LVRTARKADRVRVTEIVGQIQLPNLLLSDPDHICPRFQAAELKFDRPGPSAVRCTPVIRIAMGIEEHEASEKPEQVSILIDLYVE